MQTPRLLWCHRLHRSPHAPSILVSQSQRVPFLARLQPLSPHQSVPGAIRCQMDYASTRKASVPHLVRTAAEPRQNRMYTVRLSHIDEVNPTVRLIQLAIPPHVQSLEGQEERADGESDQPQPLTFLPGQWVDVHIPGLADAGGYSITSTPADAQVLPSPGPPVESPMDEETGLPPMDPRGRAPYLELAVQHAPSNPASAWLWRPKDEIQGQELSIRIGGSFVWPPSGINLDETKKVLFIAGGVGINPLISMLSHLNNNDGETALHHQRSDIHFFYSTKIPRSAVPSLPEKSPQAYLDQILFLSRLREIIHCQSESGRLRISLRLFLTNLHDDFAPLLSEPQQDLTIYARRQQPDDVRQALQGPDGVIRPEETVCYICAPPKMTDEVASTLRGLLGDGKERVLFEKWW
ncbi:hypothetical protein CNMCM8980_004279 [Aspergillus fumigatiaffinis]|uniref:FAD-binding FR-type domain-containing protein n=1 Tax=Aspergillus fumigatiaffinis TaxID=340414 RepID=A0A8H4GLJ5_9EURO|nr:hypothetical protein CNMCM5878_000349 [Aspergillus fumigatiaffinis]KAF4224265.1 hypothetical protein CNMCM6457_009589 [Aspergillus fumigatiaffinis]KAF4231258.1 hypothetical protein CNMCM6805_000204 [Aspergillus fumigatiaffinis]KAF4233609.1 hypothetical protein CNMCM8980_004279 [Aspergillus fumigatiaffinis]